MRPLVFIVNRSSGGQQGGHLLAELRSRLDPARVHELATCRLDDLITDCARRGAAAVACGGDGTVAAVLEASAAGGGGVPVGVLPLGTGNDQARTLGWAALDHGGLDHRLVQLAQAGVGRLDRWRLVMPDGARTWFNYVSLGFDARVARRFHALRHHHPFLFRSSAINKVLYGCVALADRSVPLAGGAALADAALPRWTGTVVFANIPSYAGGTRLGPGIRADDGRCDGFALPAGAMAGLALSGIRQAHRLGSRARFAFHLRQALTMQIDGEPWLAQPGPYRIEPAGTVSTLVGPSAPSAPSAGGRAADSGSGSAGNVAGA
jgi:diacylglycerol kinase (ATP)